MGRGGGTGRGGAGGSGVDGRSVPPIDVLRDRQYFHSRTAVPMTADEVVAGGQQDTDDESDEDEYKV